jgi:hypothetical protein
LDHDRLDDTRTRLFLLQGDHIIFCTAAARGLRASGEPTPSIKP